MTTVSAKAQDVQRQWFVVDASEHVLGRLATEIARVLMGKHKPMFTRHVDTGDCVVVVNCDQIQVTGQKRDQKQYHWHTGYPGGIKQRSFDQMVEKDSTRVLLAAVKRMLPRNKLGRAMLDKLFLYSGSEHPHAAQQPQLWQDRLTVTAQSLQEVS